MLAEDRRRQIFELIREEGSARVSQLSKTFSVSEPTIRSDLEKLESQGLVIRDHGGAYLRGIDALVRSQTLHHGENAEQKRLIGKKAAELVRDYDTLILDSGSTVTELARNLLDRRGLHIVTNALNIALIVGSVPSFTVLMTGGEFKAPTLSLTGENAAAVFENVFVDKLFLATAGITLEAGLTYPGFSDLPVKRAMIRAAQKVYLLADSSKIGRKSFATLGSLSAVHVLITDAGIEPRARQRLEAFGIEVLIASG
jgi:DeoR/GlpR family transcriptional regulator of sugar metabolism